MDYMDLTVHCPRKALIFNYSPLIQVNEKDHQNSYIAGLLGMEPPVDSSHKGPVMQKMWPYFDRCSPPRYSAKLLFTGMSINGLLPTLAFIQIQYIFCTFILPPGFSQMLGAREPPQSPQCITQISQNASY